MSILFVIGLAAPVGFVFGVIITMMILSSSSVTTPAPQDTSTDSEKKSTE